MPQFTIGSDDFLLDGEPFRVLSGALHYFRVHPDQWRDRIVKARQMGLNTIETYIAWNEHSPHEGDWFTDGGLDFARFLRIVHEEGMFAIVRPGPYICAEWDNGGLPAWLFRDESVGIRRSEPRYLAAVTTYLQQVYDVIAPLQVTEGGPIILVQIENEYGAYSDDKDYLRTLIDVTKKAGITVPLTSIDQPTDEMLGNGSVPELHKTASFGSRATERLATLRRHQGTGPLMCAEFWDGWFDFWGSHHHVTSTEQTVADLDDLLAAGASVNIYMFHGGTNFGFTNGANDKGTYQPTITSYDYDAPLDEAGNPTELYFAFRDVIAKYAKVPDAAAEASPPAPEFEVPFDAERSLFEAAEWLGTWTAPGALRTLDDIGHYRGFALYRTTLSGTGAGVLSFAEVRDRAAVFLDGAPVGTLLRDHHESSIALPAARGELVVLVEDQGRVNYGPRLGEHKGLLGPALLDGAEIDGWQLLPLEFGSLETLFDAERMPRPPVAGPAFLSARFDVDEPVDLFLDTAGWGKGAAWINGFALGRYWRRGPQRTLYIPAPAVRAGANELVVLEVEAMTQPTARFLSRLDLGHTDY